MLRFTTLGAVDVRDRRGHALRDVLAQPKRVALLAYLTMESRAGPVPRERLVATFWSASDAARGRNALSQALHHLRQSLGPEVIVNHGTTAVSVAPGELWCDAAAFTEALDKGEPALALDLYRGEFCPGLMVSGSPEVEQWLQQRRVALRRRAGAAARTQAERLAERGDHAGAARLAQRALAMGLDDEGEARALRALLARVGAAGAVDAGTAGASVGAGRGRIGLQAAAIAMLVLVSAGLVLARTRTGPVPDPRSLAVAPLRVSSQDTSLAFLEEGLADLLAGHLAAPGLLRVADPRTVFDAWRRWDAADEPSAGSLARRLGAGWLLSGSVFGSARRLTVTVWLAAAGSDQREVASATAPLDSLSWLAQRLAGEVLVAVAGVPAPQRASLADVPLDAVRPYIMGRAAFRGSRYEEAVRHFDQAVAADSSFALAALYGYQAADFFGSRLDLAALAWRNRALLSPADQGLLLSMTGPRFPTVPTVEERLEACERLTRLAPERPDSWYQWGDVLMHAGAWLGRDSGFARAEAALGRAVALDSGFVAPLAHLIQIRAWHDDTAAVRRLARLYFARDSTSDYAAFLRWRAAVATGDDAIRRAIEGDLDRLPASALRRLADWAVIEGLSSDLALRASDVLMRRTAGTADAYSARRLRFAAALAAGRFETARQVLAVEFRGRPDSARQMDWWVATNGWYTDGPVARLDSMLSGRLPPRSSWESGQLSVVRVVWAALHHWPATEAERAWSDWRRHPAAATADNWMVEAGRIAAGGPGAVPGLVAMLDSLRSDQVQGASGLSLYQAQLLLALGDTAGAGAAARRRPWATGGDPLVVPLLRLEGLSCEQAGDTACAIRAYRRYLELRAHPDPGGRPYADTVLAALARLSAARR